MNNERKEFKWDELKDIWINSSTTRDINIQMSDLLDEVKGKASQFEKLSIKNDLSALKASWSDFEGKISQFEKDAIKKDLDSISRLLKKFLSLFKKS